MSKTVAMLVLAAATANIVPTTTEVAQAPQTWEYLSIQHMTETFGFPFSVLIMSAFGSLVGAWNRQQDSRRNVAITFLSSTVLSISVSVLGPELLGYTWPNGGIHATAAMLLGFTAQNWGPEFVRNLGRLLPTIFQRAQQAPKDGER